MQVFVDSGPLSQDEIDNLKSFLGVLGYNPLRRHKEESELNIEPLKSYLLTNRELEIFQYLSKGKEKREICLKVAISTTTFKRDISEVLQKLQATNRTHAVSELFRLKILE